MSATFRIAKKQYTQNDLRRLMQEQKSKVKQTTATTQPKIDSPLAKYNDAGQLTCVLCKSVVRSESVWKVHVNTKAHKENVEAAKKLKEKLQIASNQKRHHGDLSNRNEEIPQKKIKVESSTSATKQLTNVNKEQNQSSVPTDFFDSNEKNKYFEITLSKTSIKKELVHIKRGGDASENTSVDNVQQMEVVDEVLPEGFFDDPIKDAKIRNSEYKDPQEEEWERFQKEIKEESTVSNAIIAEEQEEATTERQIEEIDEQIQKWSRVLDLEKKKEDVCAKVKQKVTKMQTDSDTNDDDDDNDDDNDSDNSEEINELLDWRAKSLKKIQR